MVFTNRYQYQGRSFRGGCRGRAPRARDGRDPMGARRRGSRLRPRDIRRRALLPRATECTD
ncbi:hypothetical protein NQZ68_031300, partial [Dissostichus eleginoides]